MRNKTNEVACIFLWGLSCCVAFNANEIMPHSKEYTPATIQDKTAKGLHLVMYYRTWSGHDKFAMKYWEIIAKEHNVENSTGEITLGHLDCTQEDKYCLEIQATGFPTYKFLRNGRDIGILITGVHNDTKLRDLIQEQLLKENMPYGVLLTKRELESEVQKTENNGELVVLFYSSQCQDDATLERFSSVLSNDKHKVVKVDCSKEDCSKEVGGESLPAAAIYKSGTLRKVLSLMDFIDVHKVLYLFDHRLRNRNDEL